MKRLVKVSFFLFIFYFFICLSANNEKSLRYGTMTSFTVSRQLTYTDRDFFIGLGALIKVDEKGVKEYITKSKNNKKSEKCPINIGYNIFKRRFKIERRETYFFKNKRKGEIIQLSSFFKYKKKIYMLLIHKSMEGIRNILYKLDKKKIKPLKEIKISYIKPIRGKLLGVDFKNTDKIYHLDENFEVKSLIKVKRKEYFFTDFYMINRKLFFKKVRFKQEQPGLLSKDGKSFFFKGQGNGRSLFEGYMRNQIIVGEDRDEFYITYMFPDTPDYPIFVYTKDGKCKRVIHGRINEYMWIPRGNWFENVFPPKYAEIVAISKIFCENGKIFVVFHRNVGAVIGKTRRFIQVISKKGKFLNEKEIKIPGFPVFYDREEKYFYSVNKRDFSVRKWTFKPIGYLNE